MILRTAAILKHSIQDTLSSSICDINLYCYYHYYRRRRRRRRRNRHHHYIDHYIHVNQPLSHAIQMSEKQSDETFQLSCMLITANVGTIFEESALLDLWFKQLTAFVCIKKPLFLALHCQEIGGKNYESSVKNLSTFIDKFLNDETLINEYNKVRIFLDQDFECLEKFTALGSLYLIHKTVDNVKLYNFETQQLETINGRVVENGQPKHIEKIKFPQDLFPECRSSRKGFMRTRWSIKGSIPFDMVNIHLLHDTSNLVAMGQKPSPYAQSRQRALQYTLQCLEKPLKQPSNKQTQVPVFIFGDFNFRLDTSKVIQRITDGSAPVVKQCTDSNEIVELIYHRKQPVMSDSEQSKIADLNKNAGNTLCVDEKIIMTVGKKTFDCENLDATFGARENIEWLLGFDNELDSFKSQLHEFNVSFSPSYPFKEDETGGLSYMKTRCPAWCDRILFNRAGLNLIYDQNRNQQEHGNEDKKTRELYESGQVTYTLIGHSVPMGDHKPVFLTCKLNLPINS